MRRIVQANGSGWGVRETESGPWLSNHADQLSATWHAQRELEQSAAGGELRVYSATGQVLMNQNVGTIVTPRQTPVPPAAPVPGQSQSQSGGIVTDAVAGIDRGNDILGKLGGFLPLVGTSFLTPWFSPAVMSGVSQYGIVGGVIATFALTSGIAGATYSTCRGLVTGVQIIVAYAAAVVITSLIAGALGLQSLLDVQIAGGISDSASRPPVIKAIEVGWNLLLAAIQVYGVGGAILSIVAGGFSGWWLSERHTAAERSAARR